MTKILCFIIILSTALTENTQQAQASSYVPQTGNPTPQPQVLIVTSEELEQKRLDDQKKKLEEIQRMKADPELRAQIEKEQRQRAERTAKYRAEQERIRELRKKQKEAQEKRKAEMQIKEDEKVTFEKDDSMSQTAKIKSQERNSIMKVLDGNRMNQNGKKIMFECSTKIEQFILNPSVDQEMVITFTLYIQENNVFSFAKDITKQAPLKLYVYEDNTRIIAQATFYFENGMKFNVKAGSKYVMRFYNSGSLKLVSMTYSHFIAVDQAKKMYSGQKGKSQLNTAANLMGGIQETIDKLSHSQVMDYQNSRVLIGSIQKYFGYQIVQIIFVISVCVVQIHLIKKMFNSVSIV